ncbi:MAG: hypothetical protein B6D43_04970 [Ignavibacteriales bacterium UTCHB1]|nr:MAG: hypothetical protein B6D43_04970 [Ignavibacteriales bacterium UTCHB1]
MAENQESRDCFQCLTRANTLFSSLNFEEVALLKRERLCLDFKPGEDLYHEGAETTGIFIIRNGNAKITKESSDGREQILRFTNEGDVLGYRAILSGEKYTSSATAMNNVSACLIPKEVLHSFIKKNQYIGMGFMRLLAEEVKNTNKQIIRISQKPVRERLAEAILLLKETYGYENDFATINVTLSREEIACIAGTVRETATRMLYEFKSMDIIQLSGKKIAIKDINKLIILANLIE